MRVKEVARITNVSVRTLHHYDEIGLLCPRRTPAGHRDYGPKDLERLHHILVSRVLGIGLDEIAHSLNDPHYDRREHLQQQREKLLAESERLAVMLRAVDAALREEDMTTQFKDFDHHDYEDEAKARWGETDAFKESARRTKGYGKKEFDKIKQEHAEIVEAFAVLFRAKKPAADAADVAERHRAHIDHWFYPCSTAMHVSVSQMYTDDDRFRENYDKVELGLAQYVQDAVAANHVRKTTP